MTKLQYPFCGPQVCLQRAACLTCLLYMKDRCTFMIVSRWISGSVLLRMRNVSAKSCRENQNIHFVYSNFFFFENCAVCGIMWENIVQTDRLQMTIWRMRIACWIPKATDTLRICNTYCVSATAKVARTRLHVTLYVHCLSCYVSVPPACFSLDTVSELTARAVQAMQRK